MSAIARVIAGVSGSPRCLPALRYAAAIAGGYHAVLFLVHTWVPPDGELADARCPSNYLRREWERGAWERLHDALAAAFALLDRPRGHRAHGTRAHRREPCRT